MTSSKTKPSSATQTERAAQIIGFEQGEYPYSHHISRKDYEAEKGRFAGRAIKGPALGTGNPTEIRAFV